MKNKKVLWSVVICIVSIVLLTITISVKGSEDMDKKSVVKLDSIKSINVEIGYGNVNVICADRKDLKIELLEKSFFQKPTLESNVNGDVVDIKISKPKTGFHINKNVIFNVYIPKDYNENLKIHSFSGNVVLKESNLNNVNFEVACGDVSVNDAKINKFELNSLNGSFTSNGLKSKSSVLKCKCGNINVTDFDGNLKSELETGNTKIEYSEFNNNLDVFATFGGNIDVKLKNASEFSVEASCSSGKIDSEFLMSKTVDQKENYIKGIVGTNKNKITLGTKSGDIMLRK